MSRSHLFVKGKSGNPGGVPKDPTHRIKRARMKVKEILNLLDFRPFEEMVNLFRTTKKERIKVEILIELCNYIAPKLKNVEVSSDTQNPFVINLNLKPNSNKPVLQSLEEKIIETVIDEQNEE